MGVAILCRHVEANEHVNILLEHFYMFVKWKYKRICI